MKFVLPAALAAATSLLSACGGGDPAPDAGGVTLTGVVAVGAPMAGTTIEAWCAIDGERVATGTTNAGGIYTLQVPRPCEGAWLLHTTHVTPIGEPMVVISQLPSGGPTPIVIHANITPLTTVLAQAQHQSTRIEEMIKKEKELKGKTIEQKLQAQKKKEDLMQQALDRINEFMKKVADQLVTLEKIRDTPFKPVPGDAMDDLLEEFVKMRGKVTAEALLQNLRPSAGSLADGLPWKTLFGERTSLTLAGTDCVASGPAGGVTATLRMQGKELLVDMVSDTLGSRTLTVGSAVRSDFGLSVGRGLPHVQLYVYESGNGTLEVTTDAESWLHFSMGSSTASCKLATPLLRADLVDFHVSNRILSAAPEGASGSCAASTIGPAFDYAISALGDVRFDGASLPPDWLDRPDAIYTERLQYRAPGAGTNPSFQIQLGPAEDRGIQPYYYHSVPYGVNCRDYW